MEGRGGSLPAEESPIRSQSASEVDCDAWVPI